YVENAEPGDAIAIRIRSIRVTSVATASGNDQTVEGRFLGDPYVAARCPECGADRPETRIEGIGMTAIRCVNCGADVTPFKLTNRFTIAFDENRESGVTLHREAAGALDPDGMKHMSTTENSVQNPIISFAPHDIVGAAARIRPFLGQLGTTPSRPFP